MSIPVPEYIKSIAKIEKSNKSRLTVSIRCECGCDEFDLFKNSFTKEQEEEIKRAEDEFKELVGQCSILHSIDKDGTVHTYITKFGIKKEVNLPELPDYATLAVYKIKCVSCNNEYIIFDNRNHGYNAVFAESGKSLQDFPFDYKKIDFRDNLTKRILIKYENFESLKDFIDACDVNTNMEEYSNSFSWIEIIAVSKIGRKKYMKKKPHN